MTTSGRDFIEPPGMFLTVTTLKDPAKLRGRIRHNKTVHFPGVAEPGTLAQVEIESATSTTLAGSERVTALA